MTPIDVANDAEQTLPGDGRPQAATMDVALPPDAGVDPVPIGDPDEDEGYDDEDDEDDEEEEGNEEPLQCLRP